MADSNVPITAGSGTNIDTFTQAGGDHRQAVVLGDAVNADVAGVANGALAVNGGALLNTSGNVAAAGTGTIGPLNVATAGNVTYVVKNTTAGSAWGGAPVVVFEQSDDNTSWAPLFVVRGDTGQVSSQFTLGPGAANVSYTFDGAVEGVTYVRARVTTGPTTNSLTVVIEAGGMPFPQGNTVLAAPLDGHKASYIGTPSSSSFVPHLVLTGSWLRLSNPSASGKIYRVSRLRVELTIATAAVTTFYVSRQQTPGTGGTSTGGTVGQLDQSDPASSATIEQFTATPTGAIQSPVAQRRLWVVTSSTAGAPTTTEIVFGAGKPVKSCILRPGNALGVGWVAVPATAVAASFEFEWTEEPV